MNHQSAAHPNAPSAFFRVTDRRARKSSKVQTVRLGDDIQVRPDRLSAYCFRQSDGLAHDLMTLIGAVKFADRKLMRHHSKGGGVICILSFLFFGQTFGFNNRFKTR